MSSEELLDINRLLAVPKDGNNQRFILHSKKGNLCFKPREDTELPHPLLLTQPQVVSPKDLWIGKLYLDTFDDAHVLPKHLWP